MPDFVSGAVAVGSLLSADAAADAASAQGDLEGQRLQLEIERDRFNKGIVEEGNEFSREDRQDIIDRRTRARGMYDPLEGEVLDLARAGPDYARAESISDADVASTFATGRGQEERRQRRYGVNPYSGRSAEQGRRNQNAEALAKVGGRASARAREDDKDWSRRVAALGMGNMRDVTPSTSLQQLGVSGQSGVLKDMGASAGAEAAGAYSLAGKLGADALSYANKAGGGGQSNTNYFSGVDSSGAGGAWYPGAN